MSEQKNKCWLGIDTSNYTTSVGVVNIDGVIQNYKKILPVKLGRRGLSQSEAVFLHIKQFNEVFSTTSLSGISAIGVSTRPRNIEGSYMPCFLVGHAFAQVTAKTFEVPVYEFSHQQGHIVAGLLSADMPDMLAGHFFTFHMSGGTMELLLINGLSDISIIAKSLDITCGQLIDRIGVKLGYEFPAGKYVEQAAMNGILPEKPHVKLKDGNCCLSGVENKVDAFICSGIKSDNICLYVLETIRCTSFEMVKEARRKYGNLPCLFVGGVMSDIYIRTGLELLGNVYFTDPQLSSDNAVGIAYLAKLKYEENENI